MSGFESLIRAVKTVAELAEAHGVRAAVKPLAFILTGVTGLPPGSGVVAQCGIITGSLMPHDATLAVRVFETVLGAFRAQRDVPGEGTNAHGIARAYADLQAAGLLSSEAVDTGTGPRNFGAEIARSILAEMFGGPPPEARKPYPPARGLD